MPKPPHLMNQPPLIPSLAPSMPPTPTTTTSGQGNAQNQGTLPPGPPPIPPPLPPGVTMPPPLPRPPAPPQLPKATGSAPAPGTGAYSFMPPPMAPHMSSIRRPLVMVTLLSRLWVVWLGVLHLRCLLCLLQCPRLSLSLLCLRLILAVSGSLEL